MELFDEEEERKKAEKSQKLKRLIIVGIVLTTILIFVLIGVIYYLIYNPNKITILVNGVEDQKIESMIITETSKVDDSTIIYAPIRRIAEYWKYRTNIGEYNTNLQDINSCSIESSDGFEVVIFKLDSKEIYKIYKGKNGYEESETIKIENPIIKRNNELYIDRDGMIKAFNLIMSKFDEKAKKVTIGTLNNYVAQAKNVVAKQKAKYKSMSDIYVNQKATLDGMIVVETVAGYKGVTDLATGTKEITSMQYDDVTYVPQNQVYIVKKDGKVGILGFDQNEKRYVEQIRLADYDSLTLIDSEKKLYMAQSNGRYGVIDENGNIVIHIEYNKIGVDTKSFEKNGIRNGYVLLNKLIPVQLNGLWGFFYIESQKGTDGTTQKISARQITRFEFNNIGCITNSNKNIVDNIMVMEDYELVVVGKNGLYGFMYPDGKPAIALSLTDLYMETVSGEVSYYMVKNNQTIDMIKYFEENAINKVK